MAWITSDFIMALAAYGFVATFQPDPPSAAYGGIFVAGSFACTARLLTHIATRPGPMPSWGVLVDGFRSDSWDLFVNFPGGDETDPFCGRRWLGGAR